MGMNSTGEIDPTHRVVPAQERLGAEDAAVDEADDRLVGEVQSAGNERGTQATFGAQALPQPLA